MIALKSFQNKSFGKIKKGQTIPVEALKLMDVKALEKAGFIGEEKNLDTPVKIEDSPSFRDVKSVKKKDSKK